MSTQHLKSGERFVTYDTVHGQNIVWQINQWGIPTIIRREDPDGVSA